MSVMLMAVSMMLLSCGSDAEPTADNGETIAHKQAKESTPQKQRLEAMKRAKAKAQHSGEITNELIDGREVGDLTIEERVQQRRLAEKSKDPETGQPKQGRP